MDTKLKNCNEQIQFETELKTVAKRKSTFFVPFIAWLSFIVGITLMVFLPLFTMIHVDGMLLRDAVCDSPYHTYHFRSQIHNRLVSARNWYDNEDSFRLGNKHTGAPKLIANYTPISENNQGAAKIVYYNPENTFAYSNDLLSDPYLDFDTAQRILESYVIEAGTLPGESVIVSYLGKHNFSYYINGVEYSTYSEDGYYDAIANRFGIASTFYYDTFANSEDGIYIYYLREDSSGLLHSILNYWERSRIVLAVLLVSITVVFLLTLLGFCMRKSRKAFVAKIMTVTGWLYSEIKVLAIVFLSALLLNVASEISWVEFFPEGIMFGCFLALCYWCLWYCLMDLFVHRKTYLKHTIFCSTCRSMWMFINRMLKGKPFKRRLLWQLIAFLAIECFLVLLIMIMMVMDTGSSYSIAFFLSIIGIGFAVGYAILFERALTDYSAILDQIAAMHRGDALSPLTLHETSLLYPAAAQLNDLQNGMTRTLENMLRSERMKIELITNVSHDLKTPLTSIISYTKLLSDMDLSPGEANDYVKIVSRKAERLHRLTNDLFDISKVESGNMPMHLERIDVSDHLRQTLAEMDSRISDSDLDFKVQIPNEAIYILADGEKLYRIFENLIGNALKYAMPHTRVYLSIHKTDTEAVIVFKNVASYEMNFDAEEIIARFTRGDSSRTEEGSGLGLAICRSFTQSFGGEFRIELDGDLFKATVILPLYTDLL